MIWSTTYAVLIVFSILLYLWQDGLKLLADICGFLVFTLLMMYLICVAVPCVIYLALLVVVCPVLRVMLRVDTTKWMQGGLNWLLKPLNARWFKAIISPEQGGKKNA